MRPLSLALLATAPLLLASSIPVHADNINYRSKVGFFGKGVPGREGGRTGWLAGMQAGRYFQSSPLYYGAEIAYGEPSAQAQSELTLVGILIGGESVSGKLLLGASLAVSAYQGRSSGSAFETSGAVAAEPQAYLGLIAGGGWRVVLNGGYLHVSNVPLFSGPTVGIRLDYKTETTIRGVDD